MHHLSDSWPQLPALELPDEAQQTTSQMLRGEHQPLQRQNLPHNSRIREYVENHFHTGATHANGASKTPPIPEIPIAQIHERNRKAPSQDPIARL